MLVAVRVSVLPASSLHAFLRDFPGMLFFHLTSLTITTSLTIDHLESKKKKMICNEGKNKEFSLQAICRNQESL